MKQTIEKLAKENSLQWPDFFQTINDELNTVENNLKNDLASKGKLLKEIISYIFESGGKRIRPALCLLTGKATGTITEKHIILAEITELIHTASLIHDDIIDSAKLRRGKETINSLWNDKISVITGDFLFAEASVRLGILENTDIVKIYAKVLSDLCSGEIDQFSSLYNTDISWEYYIEKSTAKTASLFAACCKSSTILNNKSQEVISQADNFGKCFGIAFQIIDDILDFTGSSKELGKEICADLKQGIITAPVIFALKSTDERARQIKILIQNRFNDDVKDFDKTIRLICELGSCEKAKNLAFKYVNKAKENLSFIPEAEIKQLFSNALDYILSRA